MVTTPFASLSMTKARVKVSNVVARSKSYSRKNISSRYRCVKAWIVLRSESLGELKGSKVYLRPKSTTTSSAPVGEAVFPVGMMVGIPVVMPMVGGMVGETVGGSVAIVGHRVGAIVVGCAIPEQGLQGHGFICRTLMAGTSARRSSPTHGPK